MTTSPGSYDSWSELGIVLFVSFAPPLDEGYERIVFLLCRAFLHADTRVVDNVAKSVTGSDVQSFAHFLRQHGLALH